jgi:3-oxoacyl-[acyl-carrier-protein] synthase-3
MGALIESAHACGAEPGEGFVALAARAAAAALARARREASDLDLILCAGIYRDGHVGEPAMAPLVQARLGAGLDPPSRGERGRSVLSFDVANGGCGVLDAARLADGLLRSGRAERALVVAADVDPAPGASRGLDFDPAGGALLLRAGANGEGFTAFASESFAKHADLAGAALRWVGPPAGGHELVRHEDPRYADECARCAASAAARFLSQEKIARRDVDLVLPAQSPRGFPEALAERAGLAGRVIDATAELGSFYTAGLPAAVAAAQRSGAWQRARTVLFVAVGAGLDVALALYANRAGY